MVIFAAQGDPARSMALLWRTPASPVRTAPGPRPGLSVDTIVDAGIAVADADGMGGLMRDQPSASRRPATSRAMATVAGLLVGAVALCVVGSLPVIENYDGVLSWLNPVAVGSCCGAVTLVVAAPLAWWLMYDAKRDRASRGQNPSVR